MGKHKIYTVPNKLPMIVKPKPYSANTSGGYLLNDIQFNEDIFIEKKAYSVWSELSLDNNVYDLVNTINSTPFKINKLLLNYITHDRFNLLYDPNIEHEYANLEKRTKYQDKIYKS